MASDSLPGLNDMLLRIEEALRECDTGAAACNCDGDHETDMRYVDASIFITYRRAVDIEWTRFSAMTEHGSFCRMRMKNICDRERTALMSTGHYHHVSMLRIGRSIYIAVTKDRTAHTKQLRDRSTNLSHPINNGRADDY